MEIKNQTNKIKCDMGRCKNMASYTIMPDDVPQEQYIHLCDECIKKLYELTSKVVVPKSVKNVYARNTKRG